MAHSNMSTICWDIIKLILILLLKLMAIVLSFSCKMAGMVLTNISEILDRLLNENKH